jgi:hypothetical protein
MTKLSIVVVSLAGLGSVAVAQKAGSGAGSAAAPKAGAGSAAAKTEAKDMYEMKAPTEIADMGKQMAGTWKCKGQGLGPDMKTMIDMVGTMKSKLESENWWIHDTFDSTMAKSKYHFDSYVTYDPTSKTWHRAMIETGGGLSQGESKGMEGGKLDWELASKGPMGDAMFRDHIDASDPKAGVKAWGEASMDKGKNWMKVYEITCKK